VEVALVRKLHSELEDKKKRLDDMNEKSNQNASTLLPAAAVPISFRKRRKQEIEEHTEQRAILMVVINALVNFFFRLPELFFLFSRFQLIFPTVSFFHDLLSPLSPNLANFTTDLTYFCYILTFTANFIIYYLFNLKFKQTFSEWTHTKKRN
jgi:hypothetical protein